MLSLAVYSHGIPCFHFCTIFFSVVQDTFHANLMNCEINKSYLDRVNHTHETQQHLAYIIWYS